MQFNLHYLLIGMIHLLNSEIMFLLCFWRDLVIHRGLQVYEKILRKLPLMLSLFIVASTVDKS